MLPPELTMAKKLLKKRTRAERTDKWEKDISAITFQGARKKIPLPLQQVFFEFFYNSFDVEMFAS